MKSRIRKIVIKLIKFLVKKYSITGTEINTVEIKHTVHYAELIELRSQLLINDEEMFYIPPTRQKEFVESKIRRLRQEFLNKVDVYVKQQISTEYNGPVHVRLSLKIYDQNK